MANEIKLITFADSEVTATDDAYVYESAIGEGGIINGCEVTIKNASELHINGGNGVLCGRKFTVYDSDIPVTLSSSGTLLGRLYIHMDLSNASTPIQLMIETGGSLTPVQQDADVNATNGVYEINLSTFNVDTSTISDLVDVSPKVYTHEVLNTIEECEASTNPGDVAGASVAATLNSKFEYCIGDTIVFSNAMTVGFSISNNRVEFVLQLDKPIASDVATATAVSGSVNLYVWNGTQMLNMGASLDSITILADKKSIDIVIAPSSYTPTAAGKFYGISGRISLSLS